MLPLKTLWVNAEAAFPRELWRDAVAAVCDVCEVDAISLASSSEVDWDLVCFNFDFPEMSGLRLIPQSKQRWPSTPIVMITLQCSSELAIWALRARVFDLLVKPISPGEVARCLERVLEAVRARRIQSARRPQQFMAQMPTEVRYRPRTTASSRLQRAVAHIAKHYTRHILESEVAEVCEMSPSRFCREFKAEFGITFVEYLSRHRVTEAKRLLNNLNMSVTDVAVAVGFTDPSYFGRVFRKTTGDSPSEYRDAQLNRSGRTAGSLDSVT